MDDMINERMEIIYSFDLSGNMIIKFYFTEKLDILGNYYYFIYESKTNTLDQSITITRPDLFNMVERYLLNMYDIKLE